MYMSFFHYFCGDIFEKSEHKNLRQKIKELYKNFKHQVPNSKTDLLEFGTWDL